MLGGAALDSRSRYRYVERYVLEPARNRIHPFSKCLDRIFLYRRTPLRKDIHDIDRNARRQGCEERFGRRGRLNPIPIEKGAPK